MRSRPLLARTAALILAAGALLVIPTSPAASVDCGGNHLVDSYDNGGIDFQTAAQDGTPLRFGAYVDCRIVAIGYVPDANFNVRCAKNVDGNDNDWVYGGKYSPEYHNDYWARESQLDVPNGDRWVAKCFSSGLVHITQNPLG